MQLNCHKKVQPFRLAGLCLLGLLLCAVTGAAGDKAVNYTADIEACQAKVADDIPFEEMLTLNFQLRQKHHDDLLEDIGALHGPSSPCAELGLAPDVRSRFAQCRQEILKLNQRYIHGDRKISDDDLALRLYAAHKNEIIACLNKELGVPTVHGLHYEMEASKKHFLDLIMGEFDQVSESQ